jgi:multisubunit Na+/H+ antiporter MnhG subunit
MADRPDAAVIARASGIARTWLVIAGGLAPVVAALALWRLGVESIDVGRMNDLGLISVLPPPVFASIALLIVSGSIQLRRDPFDGRVLALHLVAFVFVLYATPPFVEDVPRTSTVWTHLGFMEYIARTGTIAQDIDARMSWPGFFVGGAFLRSLVGPGFVAALAQWASVLFNLLYLLPIAVIAQALTRDRRLGWASAFVFALTNWIGQDYFSPQAFTYFLYLVIIAMIVSWFLIRTPRSVAIAEGFRRVGRPGKLLSRVYALLTPDNQIAGRLSAPQQLGALGLMLVLFACITFSHQLMPFVTTGSLLALLVFNRLSLRSIPILFGLMAVAWVSYMTVPFLAGHVSELIREFGSVEQTISNGVTGRIGGSLEHELVVVVRLVFTVALWGLAGLGALLRFRNGRRDLTTVLLAGAPFALIALQGYGGEIVLRLYFFSLPFVVILVAGIVYGRQSSRPGVWVTGMATLGACVIALGFLIARYGNERLDLMTSREIQALEVLYQTAPVGSYLVATTADLPWKFEKVEQYQYIFPETVTVADVEKLMRDPKYDQSYLILTKSQGAWEEVFVGMPAGFWDGFVAEVNATPAFSVIYSNPDAEIVVLADHAPRESAR